MITGSETAAIDTAIEGIGATFAGITQFMADNWLFGALMGIVIVSAGVVLFKRIVRRFRRA